MDNEVRPPIIVQRAEISLIESFHACLDTVAREKIFIEMIEAPPFEKVAAFQTKLIESGAPVAYATLGRDVIGWCDIAIGENPRLRHRGGLGMGIHRDFRGQGLGSRLMSHALEQAGDFGLEKVELMVYVSNHAAIALYKKHGFEREGLLRNYRKLDGESFDCLAMAKFL